MSIQEVTPYRGPALAAVGSEAHGESAEWLARRALGLALDDATEGQDHLDDLRALALAPGTTGAAIDLLLARTTPCPTVRCALELLRALDDTPDQTVENS